MISSSTRLRNLHRLSASTIQFRFDKALNFSPSIWNSTAVGMCSECLLRIREPMRVPRRFFTLSSTPRFARGSRRKIIEPQFNQMDEYLESPVAEEQFPKMYKSRNDKENLVGYLKKENIDFRDLIENSETTSGTFRITKDPSQISVNAEPEVMIRRERDQSKKVARPELDPTQTSVVLFPGQGSQFVGMGKKLLDYPNVKEIYGVAEALLRYDLLKMCLEGPKGELDKTVHCQLAVFVTSVAALEKLKAEYPMAVESCAGTAGFSVGEYAALVFAGSLSFEDGLKLVKVRAEAMQAASEVIPSGMLSVMVDEKSHLKQAMEIAKKWCKDKKDIQDPVCKVANFLFPEGKVIAGNVQALDFLEANAKQFGIRPLKRLPVSGAFHTSLMFDARTPVYEALGNIKLKEPSINVYSNVTGSAYSHPVSIRTALIKQIDQPVKWEQTMHCIYERRQGHDFPNTFEVGPGKQLGSILRRVNAKAYANYAAIEV